MKDLDDFPLYELQTLYYQFWKEKEEEKKLSKDQKAAAALNSAFEDHM